MSAAIKMARAGNRGDPGLWGFIKGVVKTGVSLATGGPTAAVSTAYSQITGRTAAPLIPSVVGATTPPRPMVLARPMNGAPYGTVVPAPGIRGAAERFFPTGETGLMVAGGANGAAPGGYHWNKTSYYTLSQGWIEAGTKLVKNRRRNPGNIKAASRSLSRVIATKKALQTFAKVTIRDPNAPKTKTVYKCGKCGHSKCRCN